MLAEKNRRLFIPRSRRWDFLVSAKLLCLLMLGSNCGVAQPQIPDTPAGRAFSGLLDAYNSGEEARMKAYLERYEPTLKAEDLMGFRDETGPLELSSIRKSEPLRIEYLLKERASATQYIGKLKLTDANPPMIAETILLLIKPGATVIGFTIDSATRARVIDGAVARLTESYVFPDIAKKMETAVRARDKRGEYDSLTDGMVFASALTDHLRDVSHDKHLEVIFRPMRIPEEASAPDDGAEARELALRENCGFERAERLTGNIGYLKFSAFADPEICGETAIAAMSFLGNSDAIIFDLRENGGGEPRMIALLSTYLFCEPTHLNDLWERESDQVEQYWTLPYVPGKRLASIPAYVLTSSATFSGAEEFANNLKVLKRATIVGEVTEGGAQPTAPLHIDDRFTIRVPFARAINPITKGNWEGRGVEPDVKVPAAEALVVAEKLALKQLTAERSKKQRVQ